MKESLRKITYDFLSNLNEESNFEILSSIEKRFDEKTRHLIFVIDKMENKKEKLLKKLKDLEKNIEKTRHYTANSMRLIGRKEIESVAKFEITEGRLNLVIKNKGVKNNGI